MKKGSTHNFGPCATPMCDMNRTWFKSEYCKACREERRLKQVAKSKAANRRRLIAQNKARAKPLPELKRTRTNPHYDKAGPDLTPAPMYKWGTVKFWARWYYEQHDEEELRRWESSLGLSHDVPLGLDTTFGLGLSPQYPKKNTVI